MSNVLRPPAITETQWVVSVWRVLFTCSVSSSQSVYSVAKQINVVTDVLMLSLLTERSQLKLLMRTQHSRLTSLTSVSSAQLRPLQGEEGGQSELSVGHPVLSLQAPAPANFLPSWCLQPFLSPSLSLSHHTIENFLTREPSVTDF